VVLEAFAGRRQSRTGSVPNEQAPTDLFFEQPDARTDRGLGQVEPVRRANEAARRDNFQKGFRQADVHPQQQHFCGKSAIPFVCLLRLRVAE
jgi:hypothetical protein